VTLGGIRYCAGGGRWLQETAAETPGLRVTALRRSPRITYWLYHKGNGPQVRLLALEETANKEPANHGATPAPSRPSIWPRPVA